MTDLIFFSHFKLTNNYLPVMLEFNGDNTHFFYPGQ